MWIVKIALNRPYTFIVLALLIFVLSPLVILRTPTDIFPNIDIPVISVAWTYTGLNPEDLEARLTTPYEKVLTTLVDNIDPSDSIMDGSRVDIVEAGKATGKAKAAAATNLPSVR
jgi:multidrug efflux pump subunit AcrB